LHSRCTVFSGAQGRGVVARPLHCFSQSACNSPPCPGRGARCTPVALFFPLRGTGPLHCPCTVFRSDSAAPDPDFGHFGQFGHAFSPPSGVEEGRMRPDDGTTKGWRGLAGRLAAEGRTPSAIQRDHIRPARLKPPPSRRDAAIHLPRRGGLARRNVQPAPGRCASGEDYRQNARPPVASRCR